MNSDFHFNLITLAFLAVIAVCVVMATKKYLNAQQSVQYITVPVLQVPVPVQEDRKAIVKVSGFAPQA